VWLAERAGKAVLKLSARDYAEHQLSPLLARFNSAGPINGQVFNRLRDKIRGRAKLPAHERVLVFSPHPDDDVISMGGILRKLWENENQIVVAYMTSGNIAVFDHDVARHLDFVERAAKSLGLAAAVRRGAARSRVRRRRPLGSARHPSHVQGSRGARPGALQRTAARGVAVSWRVAGVVADRGRRPRSPVAGRAAREDPRHLPSP